MLGIKKLSCGGGGSLATEIVVNLIIKVVK